MIEYFLTVVAGVMFVAMVCSAVYVWSNRN